MMGSAEKIFHEVSLSGGKDSTAMLLLMIERSMPIWCTGKLKTHLINKEVNRLKGDYHALHGSKTSSIRWWIGVSLKQRC